MRTDESANVDELLTQDICEDTASQWKDALADASPKSYTRLLHRLLSETLPNNTLTKNGKSMDKTHTNELLSQELRNTYHQPSKLSLFAKAIASDENLSNSFNPHKFLQLQNLDEYQGAYLCISILCETSTNPQNRETALQALSQWFPSMLRHLSAHDDRTMSVRDAAWLAQRLLNTPTCAGGLTTMQRFLVEYSFYRRYPDDFPEELKAVYSDYNQLRAEEDSSKSLAQLFEETRGAATSTLTSTQQTFIRKQLSTILPRIEYHISDLLITLINSAYAPGTWNGRHLGNIIQKLFPELDWLQILQCLDSNKFHLNRTDDLILFLDVLSGAMDAGQKNMPMSFLWSEWQNAAKQAVMLRHLTTMPASTFNVSHFAGSKVLSAENFVGAPSTLRNLAAHLETSPWNSLEILQSSLRLLSVEAAASDAKHFLEAAGKTTPELIFLGCVQLPRPWGAQQEQLCEKGCEVFFGGQPNHELVFYRLWQVDFEFLCRKFIEYHSKDPAHITRILEIAHELCIVDQLINLQPYTFAIDLAALASSRELLNIEKWLDHHLSVGRDAFIEACLSYLAYKADAENVLQQCDGDTSVVTIALRVETVAIFLKALMNTAMSPENGEFLKQVQSSCLQVYPRLMNSTNVNRDPSDSNSFAKDVEKEVEFYYGRLYEGDMTIASFVEMLQTLKRSANPRDQDIFACMLHSLFDEYRFFADYPVSALSITAILFGGLIQNQLLSYIPLGIALRYVLDAVGYDQNTNMFKFGVQALAQFKERVPEWPQYCQQILAIPGLYEYEPGLINGIRNQRNASSRAYETDEPNGSIEARLDARPHTGPIFRSLRPEPAPQGLELYSDPSVQESDKILFNLNNLSLVNLTEKLIEVKTVLQESHYSWFANHLVSQRAAIEPNYHSLYIHFLEAMQDDHLIHRVVQETIENISLLLNAENTVTSTVERTNLKNLGSWLGGLTLARNRPLKHRTMSLKDLLLEGFDDNRLIVILPFTCRVLEQTVNSKVFKPPNPWTMSILSLLMELYESADMKLNLKFEVEVLCKKLNLEMSEIPSSSVLRNRPLVHEDELFLNDHGANSITRDEEVRHLPGDSSLESNTAFVSAAIAEMPFTVHPIIQQNFSVPNLRNLFSIAAERAVREFILPVVERSVAVASISTSQLVSKDFAFEEDLNKLRRAAHTMNQNLAGSLALVTCKEPLRGALLSNMRALLTQAGFEGLSSEGENLLSQLVSDNLEILCMIVEKAAMEKAVYEIDEGLASGYQLRRKHHEAKTGQNFADPAAPRHPFPLPDPLRLKATGLTQEQLSTYEDFSRIPRTAQEAAMYYAKDEGRALVKEQETTYHRNESQSATAFEQLLSTISEIDTMARECDFSSIDDLPGNTPLRLSLQKISSYLIGLTGPTRDERILTCSQRVCQLLFKLPFHGLSAQCLTMILSSFIELSLQTFRDVSIWLVHSDDPRKFNVSVILLLIRAQIIVLPEFDVQLAKQIVLGKAQAIEFAGRLIRESVLSSSVVAFRADFTSSLDALNILRLGNEGSAIDTLLADLGSATRIEMDDNLLVDDGQIQDQLLVVFMEWVHLLSHPASTERMQLAFAAQLQSSGIATSDRLMVLFFRGAIQQSFESAIRLSNTNQVSLSVQHMAIDALARLLVLLLKFIPNSEQATICDNFRRFLDIAVIIFIHDRDGLNSGLVQRPMFRLLSSILGELHILGDGLENVSSDLLLILGETLETLRPLEVPSFSFAWVTLISHRSFMPKLLAHNEEQSWPMYSKLLTSFLNSISSSLTAVKISSNTRLIYHALLRLLLVLLNDFPGFLVEFHHTFMNCIPYGCVQLRNLILSSYPRNMLLPDPFLPGLKVDRLPESANAPRVWADLEVVLQDGKVLSHVHNYNYSLNPLMAQKVVKALSGNCISEDAVPDMVLLNTLVLHCGTQAMDVAKSPPVFEVNSPWVSLLHELFRAFGAAGRYRMLSAIANQLRYPNSHTYFFSCVLLLLFSNGSDQDALIKEQITRVLLERLICNRPHPWGLLITFTELLKNPKYGFWDLKFIRTSPEIETLFHSLFNHINHNISQSE